MKTLVKTNGLPPLTTVMEDFWNVDSFFNQPLLNWELLPAANIRNKKEAYEVEIAAPGFDKKDFNVTIENGMLTISAETTETHEEDKATYTRKEFSRSSFSRCFSLPENIADDHVKATYKDGLLHISLKKTGKALQEAKNIKVH